MTQIQIPKGTDPLGTTFAHLVALTKESNEQDKRISDLETNVKVLDNVVVRLETPSEQQIDNTATIEALKQADNAVQKAIAHFSRTAKENK